MTIEEKAKFTEQLLSKLELLNFININGDYDEELHKCTISSALKREEIEDLKHLGINMLDRLYEVLINECNQTIVKDIVLNLFTRGEKSTMEFEVDEEMPIHHSQRKLFEMIPENHFVITNGVMASVLTDGASYSLTSSLTSTNSGGMIYPIGTINKTTIYVDPYMMYNDNRILIFSGKADLNYKENIITEIKNDKVLNRVNFDFYTNVNVDNVESMIINVKDPQNYLV